MSRFPRSAANRAYYALFAETHARLIELKLEPRLNFGTWPHEELHRLAQKHMASSIGSRAAREWGHLLRKSRYLRVIADYRPAVDVNAGDVRAIIRSAGRLLEPIGAKK